MSAFITLTGSYITSDPSAGRWKNLNKDKKYGSHTHQPNTWIRHLLWDLTSTDGRRTVGYLGREWPILRHTWTSSRRARVWSTLVPPTNQNRHSDSITCIFHTFHVKQADVTQQQLLGGHVLLLNEMEVRCGKQKHLRLEGVNATHDQLLVEVPKQLQVCVDGFSYPYRNYLTICTKMLCFNKFFKLLTSF